MKGIVETGEVSVEQNEKSYLKLIIVPVSFADGCAFISRYHRHHKAPQGHKFSIGAAKGGRLVGVAIVGRPVARRLDDGWTLEVTRLCTDGSANACSKLYGACWRIVREMGYRKLITYILDSEKGTSLRAAGWTCEGKAGGLSWNVPSRPRTDKCPSQMKLRFGINLPETGG